jgi:hypothetical protein
VAMMAKFFFWLSDTITTITKDEVTRETKYIWDAN